ncbi:hypothetical protein HA402_004733 [Bradysia odoriphaga]|nr:hypothetical protein HA402_004733 [Bradysia odoriphaga]
MLTAEADKLSDQARFIMEKCNGTLVVKNKKRKTMIDELIKRGYRADPVKEWKRKISVEDEEEADGPAAEEEEELEQPSKKPKAPVDPEKAFQKLTDVKKYDYLLGMSMWVLTDERNNELKDNEDGDSDNDVKVDKDGTANFSSDDELFDNNISVNSENMFDSLKEDKSAEPSPEKPKQKRKLGPKMETAKRPKNKNPYSGSDDDFEASKPKSKKKKKAISSSD